jgi:hypothetical protein
MADDQIRYRSGYKYQLVNDYLLRIAIRPPEDITTEFIGLTVDGMLMIRRGYAWDGPSGPTFDTKHFMRGSLVHDALYQLMRAEKIPRDEWRDEADMELKRICLEDGMSKVRAWWVHRGVRLGAGPAASPEAKKKEHTAP